MFKEQRPLDLILKGFVHLLLGHLELGAQSSRESPQVKILHWKIKNQFLAGPKMVKFFYILLYYII